MSNKTLLGLNAIIDQRLAYDPIADMTTQPGQLVWFNSQGDPEGQTIQSPITTITDDSQLEGAKGDGQNMGDVFNTWERVSIQIGGAADHPGMPTLAYIPAELNSWLYDANSDKIRCTVNSGATVGFVGNNLIEDYVFECLINNNNGIQGPTGDDDTTGLILGLVVENGKYFLLSYSRNCGGHGTPIGAAGNMASLVINNNHAHPLAHTAEGLGARTMWNVWPGGCRIKVTRVGDIITCETTAIFKTYAEAVSAPFVETAKIVFDLSSNPHTQRFRGPQRFGYQCWSQSHSNWETIKSPYKKNPIINVTNSKMWIHNTVTDDYDITSIDNVLTKGLMYGDEVNKKLFTFRLNGVLEELK